MRRKVSLALRALMVASLAATASIAHAQQGPGGGGDDELAAKRKKRDAEWNQPKAPLMQLRNAGPCPFVKVLYDASRYIEFKDGKEFGGSSRLHR